jgi:hypothetical protein
MMAMSPQPGSFRRPGTWRVVCPTERLFDHRNRFGLAQTQLAQVTLTLTNGKTAQFASQMISVMTPSLGISASTTR